MVHDPMNAGPQGAEIQRRQARPQPPRQARDCDTANRPVTAKAL